MESLKKLSATKLETKQLNAIFECTIKALRNWTTIANQHLIEAVDTIVEMSPDKLELLKSLEKTVLEMGRQSEPIVSKVIAGRLIPILCRYNGRSIKGEMIDIIKRIIGDAEIEAKKVWVTEIFPQLLRYLKI